MSFESPGFPTLRVDAPPFVASRRETRLAGWFAKTLGLAVLALSAAFVVALLTWSVTDPSLSNLSPLKPKNGLGPIGAILSDLVIQSLGLASVFALLPPVFWSAQLLARSGVDGIRSKLFMAPVAVLCLAAFLSTMPKAVAWPLASGYGGLLGDFGSQFVTGLFATLNADRAPLAAGFCLMAAGFALLMLSLGLTPNDLRKIAHRPHVHLPDSGWVAHFRQTVAGTPDEDVLSAGLSAAQTTAMQQPHASVAAPPHQAHSQHMSTRPPMQVMRSASTPAEQMARLLETFAQPAPVPKPAQPAPLMRTLAPEPMAQASPPPATPPAPREPAIVPVTQSVPIHRLPPTSLLPRSTSPRAHATDVHVGEKLRAQKLAKVLGSFGVSAEIKGHTVGPVVTTFTIEPAMGTKSGRIVGLADDIARGLNVAAVRIDVAPGRTTIAIEVPHDDPVRLGLRDFVDHDSYRATTFHLPLALGATGRGEPCVADLTDLPHLLVAGTDASARAATVNGLITALLYRQTPQLLRFAMIGTADDEFAPWAALPHLTAAATTTVTRAGEILAWAAAEVDARTLRMRAMAQTQTIEEFNTRVRDLERRATPQASTNAPMPYLVIVIADAARLLADSGLAPLDAFDVIVRRGRAAGIHLIVATSHAGDDAPPARLVSAFKTRLVLQLDSKSESRAVLGETGAEDLLPGGDALLFTTNEALRQVVGGGQIHRLHAPLIQASEAKAITAATTAHETATVSTAPPLARQARSPAPAPSAPITTATWTPSPGAIDDGLYHRAVQVVRREQSAQTNLLKRALDISYPATLELLEQMARDGIVTAADDDGQRRVLMGRAA